MTNIIPESWTEKIISEKIKAWEEKRKNKANKEDLKSHSFLTVSRDFGCNEENIIPALEKEIGWSVYGKDLLNFIVERDGISHEILETLDEKGKESVYDWVNYILGTGAIVQNEYVLKISQLIKTIVSHENAIILGRGGNHILKDKPEGLRVKITAPLEDRVSHISKIRQLSAEDAKELILRKDKERVEFERNYFKGDGFNPSEFDMVLNTKSFSQEALCKTIRSAMKEKRDSFTQSN